MKMKMNTVKLVLSKDMKMNTVKKVLSNDMISQIIVDITMQI